MEYLVQFSVAFLPAVIAGIVSCFIAVKSSKQQIYSLEKQNKLEIEKLMEQHKIDLESLNRQHELDMKSMEKEHLYKLELLQKEHENELIRKEKELENSAKYSAMGNVMNSFVGGVLNEAFDNQEVKNQINEAMREAFKNRK